MFFWFAGLAFVTVVAVFASAAVDYRLVIFGAVFPAVELLWGGPWIMHTLLFPVAVMMVIMVAATGKRLTQRRWLGLAIGLLFHLVFAGTWRHTTLFWWPAFGTSLEDGHTPSLPPVGVVVVMELVGLAILFWAWRRFGLSDRDRRRRFIGTGQLDRALMRAEPPTR